MQSDAYSLALRQLGAMSPFTFWPLPLSLLCNQRDGTFVPPWNALLIQPADYQHPSHVPNVRVHFLAVSRSRSKTSVLSGRNWHLWPREARGQMLPEILGSVQCVISGQIIEIAIENPTIKDRKETSCWISAYRRLQSGWNAPCGSVSFPRAPGNVLHMTGNFFLLKEEIWFSSLAENENILFTYFARKSGVFFGFVFFKWLEFPIISVKPVEALQRHALGKREESYKAFC